MTEVRLTFLAALMAGIVAGGIVPVASAAATETGESCAALEDGNARLACYDSVFRTTFESPVIAGTGRWSLQKETSKITDKTNVYLSLNSDEDVPDRFGRGATPAILWLRCQDNTTALTVWFAGQFMADSGGYDRVIYRIDTQPAVHDSWSASTNNEAMGLWSGGTAIPLIKKLLGAQNLLVQATPFNESPITLDFKVGGLEEAIKPLRQACGW